MTEEELYKEAYRLFCKDYVIKYDLEPMTIWGFINILVTKEREEYLDKAIISIRKIKINQIKQKYENR